MNEEDKLEKDREFKAGFVALVGKPNVGKSTILNNILGTKVSIVSSKPQTTRMRILGVKHDNDAQIIFLDTPGVQKGKDLLTQSVMESAIGSMQEADVIAFIIDDRGWTKEDDEILEKHVKPLNKPTILVINKVDRIKDKRQLLPLIDKVSQKYNFVEIFPMSAIKGDNILEFVNTLKKYLPVSPPLYPKDQITDLPLKFYIAEIIREKVFKNTSKEIPYSVAVEVESIEEGKVNKNLLIIRAIIYVEKENHKKIIIGKKGQMLKKIGKEAREELEHLLGKKIHLELWVKVKPKWKENLRLIQSLGYGYLS
ncbi:MAG: GTPase Era [Persephonella sp.]|nr:MAG: GTPase Era [Persephonella sp.]